MSDMNVSSSNPQSDPTMGTVENNNQMAQQYGETVTNMTKGAKGGKKLINDDLKKESTNAAAQTVHDKDRDTLERMNTDSVDTQVKDSYSDTSARGAMFARSATSNIADLAEYLSPQDGQRLLQLGNKDVNTMTQGEMAELTLLSGAGLAAMGTHIMASGDSNVRSSVLGVDLVKNLPQLSADKPSLPDPQGAGNEVSLPGGPQGTGNAWFGSNPQVAYFRNFMSMFDSMKDIQSAELRVTLNQMAIVMDLAQSSAGFIMAAAHKEAMMHYMMAAMSAVSAGVSMGSLGYSAKAGMEATSSYNQSKTSSQSSMNDKEADMNNSSRDTETTSFKKAPRMSDYETDGYKANRTDKGDGIADRMSSSKTSNTERQEQFNRDFNQWKSEMKAGDRPNNKPATETYMPTRREPPVEGGYKTNADGKYVGKDGKALPEGHAETERVKYDVNTKEGRSRLESDVADAKSHNDRVDKYESAKGEYEKLRDNKFREIQSRASEKLDKARMVQQTATSLIEMGQNIIQGVMKVQKAEYDALLKIYEGYQTIAQQILNASTQSFNQASDQISKLLQTLQQMNQALSEAFKIRKG